MIELYNKKFVYFEWNDRLRGKECFVADDITGLKTQVIHGLDANLHRIENSKRASSPFEIVDNEDFTFTFAYYDPNYSVKKAFNEGKKIQVKKIDSSVDWADCDEPLWNEDCHYRVKPEEKWIAYLARKPLLDKSCYLTSCREDMWESAQKDYGAKTKLFVGTENKAIEWYKSHQKFAEVIKAWEDGKKIQFKSLGFWLPTDPIWDVDAEYRVEPEKEKRWIVYLARPKNGDCYLDACTEDNWRLVQKECGAKRNLFMGTEREARQWYKSLEKFAKIIEAWEDNKPIEYYSHIFKHWTDLKLFTAYFEGNVSDYRIRSLKWKDLKIGDVLRRYYDDGDYVSLVINGIKNTSDTNQHILLGGTWIPDEELEFWEKE